MKTPMPSTENIMSFFNSYPNRWLPANRVGTEFKVSAYQLNRVLIDIKPLLHKQVSKGHYYCFCSECLDTEYSSDEIYQLLNSEWKAYSEPAIANAMGFYKYDPAHLHEVLNALVEQKKVYRSFYRHKEVYTTYKPSAKTTMEKSHDTTFCTVAQSRTFVKTTQLKSMFPPHIEARLGYHDFSKCKSSGNIEEIPEYLYAGE